MALVSPITPALSVVVTSSASGAAADLLVTLLEQSRAAEVEIILARGVEGPSETPGVVDDLRVHVIEVAREPTLPQLLGAAIARSRGGVIAITDSTCAVASDWVREILEAHREPDLVLGGVVEPRGLRRLVDWAAYFCEYGQFMAPIEHGITREVPGNNISFKRSALERGREFVTPEFWKTYWCRRLEDEGTRLRTAPSVVVYYGKSFRLFPFLNRRFQHGRCFAGMRLAGRSAGWRAVWALAALLLPLLLSVRLLRAIFPKRRYLVQFLLSLPISLLAILSWSIGEMVGYALGAGTSCRHVR